jgi:predicted metal-dependent hydrolase
VNTDELPLTIKRLRSSKSLKLRVYEDGRVVVTAPRFVLQGQVDRFIAEHIEWIHEKRSSVLKLQSSLIDNRSTLFFRGQEMPFRLSISTTKKASVEIIDQTILVTAPNEDHVTVRSLLEKWYRKQAEKYFKERLPLLSDLVNKDVRNITIRSQRTRWGSCSSRTTISLNWRLVMAPDSVSDYVIYHELAHLTHMNHSKKFWQLVEDYCPNYKDAEKWLREHHKLLRF